MSKVKFCETHPRNLKDFGDVNAENSFDTVSIPLGQSRFFSLVEKIASLPYGLRFVEVVDETFGRSLPPKKWRTSRSLAMTIGHLSTSRREMPYTFLIYVLINNYKPLSLQLHQKKLFILCSKIRQCFFNAVQQIFGI